MRFVKARNAKEKAGIDVGQRGVPLLRAEPAHVERSRFGWREWNPGSPAFADDKWTRLGILWEFASWWAAIGLDRHQEGLPDHGQVRAHEVHVRSSPTPRRTFLTRNGS